MSALDTRTPCIVIDRSLDGSVSGQQPFFTLIPVHLHQERGSHQMGLPPRAQYCSWSFFSFAKVEKKGCCPETESSGFRSITILRPFCPVSTSLPTQIPPSMEGVACDAISMFLLSTLQRTLSQWRLPWWTWNEYHKWKHILETVCELFASSFWTSFPLFCHSLVPNLWRQTGFFCEDDAQGGTRPGTGVQPIRLQLVKYVTWQELRVQLLRDTEGVGRLPQRAGRSSQLRWSNFIAGIFFTAALHWT